MRNIFITISIFSALFCGFLIVRIQSICNCRILFEYSDKMLVRYVDDGIERWLLHHQVKSAGDPAPTASGPNSVHTADDSHPTTGDPPVTVPFLKPASLRDFCGILPAVDRDSDDMFSECGDDSIVDPDFVPDTSSLSDESDESHSSSYNMMFLMLTRTMLFIGLLYMQQVTVALPFKKVE